jgi:hypothetical protein
MKKILSVVCLIATGLLLFSQAFAQDTTKTKTTTSAQQLANKLSNPVASLISVPLQNNIDWGIGDHNGSKNVLNVQPVIPIKLSSKWNLITRWIIPVVTQRDITTEGVNQAGLSDATLSAFISPSEGKIIWGVGPAFLVPIATNDALGAGKFGVGPTVLALRQTHGWTFGALVNQIFSVAGDADRPDVNQLFVQPFLAYNYKSGAGISVNVELTENWEASTTIATLNPVVTGITKLGKQIVSLQVGPRIPLAAPDKMKAALGIRSVLTFVFPK